VATLYVRDVPERLYKRLRARARRNGRSLNSEVLAILGEVDLDRTSATPVTDELFEIAKRIKRSGPPTDWVAVIRAMREERDAELFGR
jgi:plasmid stability protein